MAKLLIGCYSYDSSSNYGTKYTSVVTWLGNAVKELEKVRGSLVGKLETKNGFQAIFVATEYMFTGENTTKLREPMLVSEKNDLVRDIKEISKKYSEILIFPGSIFYKEPLGASTVEGVTAKHKAMANLISAELASASMKPRDQSDVLGGWKTGGGVSVPGIKDMSGPVAKPKLDTYRAYNSVQAFLAGDTATKTAYVKNWDFKETEGASVEKLMYVPGSHSGRRTILSFEFGIEVCFDHANGALQGSKSDVDFHIVVSASVETEEAQMAMKKGGYFIHASSDPSQTTVYARNALGALAKVTLAGGKIESNSLAYWLVDVEARAAAKTAVAASTGSTVVTPSGKKITGGIKVM